MRFEQTIRRYTTEDVICRIFDLLKFPSPPAGKARASVEGLLKTGLLSATHPHRERMATLLEMIDTPTRTLTLAQVQGETTVGRTLYIVEEQRQAIIEIHAGIGAIFHRNDNGTGIMRSEVAPITGAGMELRRDYLLSTIEAARDTLERTFS